MADQTLSIFKMDPKTCIFNHDDFQTQFKKLCSSRSKIQKRFKNITSNHAHKPIPLPSSRSYAIYCYSPYVFHHHHLLLLLPPADVQPLQDCCFDGGGGWAPLCTRGYWPMVGVLLYTGYAGGSGDGVGAPQAAGPPPR